VEQEIHTVVIGDIRGIRERADFGSKINQKLHGLPYEKLCGMLEYKLEKEGIRFVRQKEYYTSQCPPDSPEVSKELSIS
jgi:putative transposase